MKYASGMYRCAVVGVIWMLSGSLVGCDAAGSGEADAGSDVSPDASPDAMGDVASSDAGDAADTAADDAAADDADASPPRTTLRVMTYNIMCSVCVFKDYPDWVTDWDARLPWLQDTIARHDPDLFGLQEQADIDPDHPDQVAAFDADGTYGAVWYLHQETDPFIFDNPDAAIYYRKSRFDVLETGVFWLSPTPDVPWSFGWQSGAALPRLVVWATLYDRVMERELTFASTHFDNNQPNQVMSAPLALERLAPLAAERPTIFVGDFNSAPDTEAFAILAHGVDGTGFHFDDTLALHGGEYRLDTGDSEPVEWLEEDRIDHIWVAAPSGSFEVTDWGVDLHLYGELNQAASDHFAVFSELEWVE